MAVPTNATLIPYNLTIAYTSSDPSNITLNVTKYATINVYVVNADDTNIYDISKGKI